MDEKEHEPSQAESLTAVSRAGPSAADKNAAPERSVTDKPANTTSSGRYSPSSTPSDLEAPQEKVEESNEPSPRSSLKIGLIMASLCVSYHQRTLPQPHK